MHGRITVHIHIFIDLSGSWQQTSGIKHGCNKRYVRHCSVMKWQRINQHDNWTHQYWLPENATMATSTTQLQHTIATVQWAVECSCIGFLHIEVYTIFRGVAESWWQVASAVSGTLLSPGTMHPGVVSSGMPRIFVLQTCFSSLYQDVTVLQHRNAA